MATDTIAPMTDTNGTPQILIDIKFDVIRKGYDPSQVDSYLERVGAAVAQMQEKLRDANAAAATAEERATGAERALAAAEAELAALQGAAPVAEPVSIESEIEAAAGVLAMAQRTADAAVHDARTNAASMVASAEAEAANILRDAQRRAEAAVGELETRRSELEAEGKALAAFMDEQRAFLASDVARLQAVLDDPRALRVAPIPASVSPSVSAISTEPEIAVPSSDLPTKASPVVEAEAVEVSRTELEAEQVEVAETSGENADEAGAGDQLFGEDDAADEAMRKFFDADFDDDDRFGR